VFGPGRAFVIVDGVFGAFSIAVAPSLGSSSDERGIAQRVTYDDGIAR
jgi:hypothetical protein